ncbi:MAG TPA: hypothetical protein V6C65_18380 [Allocoleopsis sp.]
MFGKKPPSDPSELQLPNQSQSLSNVSLTGGMVQLGQAGGNLQQNQSGELQTEQQGIPATEVVALLEQLESAVKGSGLRRFLTKNLPVFYNRDNPPKNQGASV